MEAISTQASVGKHWDHPLFEARSGAGSKIIYLMRVFRTVGLLPDREHAPGDECVVQLRAALKLLKPLAFIVTSYSLSCLRGCCKGTQTGDSG